MLIAVIGTDVMTLGLGHPIGPFALMDMIGLDVCLAIFESLDIAKIGRLRQLVAAGYLGRKFGRGFFARA